MFFTEIKNLFKTIVQGFSPLVIPNFRMYISGQAVSLIGTWLQVTAQSWVVWELSHSEASLGITAMFAALPTLLLGPWAGVLADRSNRRALLIFSQTGMMILAFILAALVQFGLVQIWHVYLLSLLLGVFSALDFPTQQAFLGDLSGMGEVRKAVNMNAMMFQASRMIGPALAGWVIAQWNPATAFWLNGISFLAVIASLIAVRANQVKRPHGNSSIFADLAQAFHWVSEQPRIQDLLLLSISITMFAISTLNLLPAFAAKRLAGDASTLGALLGASGAGALTSLIFIMPLAQARQRQGLVVNIAVIWSGVWFLLLSTATHIAVAMLALYLASMSLPLVVAMTMGMIQVLAPLEMRARVLSLFTMVSFGLQPLSALAVGWIGEQFGVTVIALLNGTLLIFAGILLFLTRKGLKEWRPFAHRPKPTDAPVVVTH